MNSIRHVVESSRRLLDQVEGVGMFFDRQIRHQKFMNPGSARLASEIDQIRRQHAQVLRELAERFVLNSQCPSTDRSKE